MGGITSMEKMEIMKRERSPPGSCNRMSNHNASLALPSSSWSRKPKRAAFDVLQNVGWQAASMFQKNIIDVGNIVDREELDMRVLLAENRRLLKATALAHADVVELRR